MTVKAKGFEQVVEASIEHELESIELYSLLKEKVKDEQTAKTLGKLMEFEENHLHELIDFLTDVSRETRDAIASVRVLKDRRKALSKQLEKDMKTHGLSDVSTPLDIIEYALSREAETEKKYKSFVKNAKDNKLIAILKRISEEEEAHAALLTEWLEKEE